MSQEPTGARPGAAAGGPARAGLGASLARFVPILAWAPAYKPT
jgi:hypothetical protein